MKRFVVPIMILVLGVILVACASAQGNWADRVTISGYLQARYDGADIGPTAENDFTLRRAFFNIAAQAGDRTNVVLTLATFDRMPPTSRSDDIMVYNLFIDHKINDVWSARFGQVPTYFGLEGWQGSSQRVALERARILQGSGAGNNTSGFYFFGAPDRGLWLKRTAQAPNQPDVYLGVCNGQGRASDVDGDKNVSVDLKWEHDWGICGVSWFDGAYTGPGGKNSRHATDAYVKLTRGQWDVQAEWANGRMLGAERDGWYIQVCQVREDRNWTPYVKYEEFNSVGAGGPMKYDAIHGGVAWQLDKNNEVTIQLTEADWNGADDFQFGVQWQAGF